MNGDPPPPSTAFATFGIGTQTIQIVGVGVDRQHGCWQSARQGSNKNPRSDIVHHLGFTRTQLACEIGLTESEPGNRGMRRSAGCVFYPHRRLDEGRHRPPAAHFANPIKRGGVVHLGNSQPEADRSSSESLKLVIGIRVNAHLNGRGIPALAEPGSALGEPHHNVVECCVLTSSRNRILKIKNNEIRTRVCCPLKTIRPIARHIKAGNRGHGGTSVAHTMPLARRAAIRSSLTPIPARTVSVSLPWARPAHRICPGVSDSRNRTFCIFTGPSSSSSTVTTVPSAWYWGSEITPRTS